MYITHFGLKTPPFAITPDPHFLYLSERHREALAHLLYGINEGTGFVLLTGEVGTGKTTLCRSLMEQLSDNVDVALLFNPRLSSMELLAALFDELRIEYQRNIFTLKDFIDTLNTYLLTAHSVGRKTVLILDEAQNLTSEALEQIRLLTNLETTHHKLLQIILVGQPELNSILKRRNLRQLAQRITARYHLLPLSAKDTDAYINHRLAISGAKAPLFTNSAMRLIYRYSSGIPRLINIICDRALLGGYVNNQRPINNNIVRKAVREVRGETVSRINLSSTAWLTTIFIIVLLFGGFMWWVNTDHNLNEISQKVVSLPITPPKSSKNPPVQTTEATASPTSVTTTQKFTFSNLSLSELLQQIDPKGNTDTALITLFRQWQLDYTQLKGETACERAANQGLACLYKGGDWEDIRRYNRPAVIELISDKGTQHLVAITKLREHTVTLNFAGDTYEFTTDQLSSHWLGQFLLLWRPPTLPAPLLKQGMSSESVLWLRRRLAALEGKDIKELSTRFDNQLKNSVINFQKRHNLLADGIVGEQTIMMLNTESGEVPLLWLKN